MASAGCSFIVTSKAISLLLFITDSIFPHFNALICIVSPSMRNSINDYNCLTEQAENHLTIKDSRDVAFYQPPPDQMFVERRKGTWRIRTKRRRQFFAKPQRQLRQFHCVSSNSFKKFLGSVRKKCLP